MRSELYWEGGDLDDLARSDAEDGAADAVFFEEQRREEKLAARVREERFRVSVEHLRGMACMYLLTETRRDLDRAKRFARAAERVDQWRDQAFKKGYGR